MADAESGPDLLNELAHEFAERYRNGERPALTEYTDPHPELAEQIRDLFPALVVMEEFGSVAGQPSADPHGLSGPDGRQVPRQLGEYRILREVGRGGMGIVYEAVQESLGRHVALKVLPLHGLAARSHLERFEREARAVARLHHTNIVPVFGSGEHAGVHYYAMQFIQGQGLEAVLNEVRRMRGASAPAGGPLVSVGLARGLLTGRLGTPEAPFTSATTVAESTPRPDAAPTPRPALGEDHPSDLTGPPQAAYFRGVARLGVQVAEALAYAHRQGIVHRDVKPSNLLLDTQGVVWVTDFGLAKDEGGDNLTHTGDVLGTVRYMAPERFDGQGDARSDIYSLGATLYELLTLQPVFVEAHRARLVERVLHEDPVPPRKLDPKVPRDLETTVLKAMAKDPDGRYPTADDLADDLRRYLTDRPIRARRSSAVERTWRWCRRNPTVAGLLTAVAVLLCLIAVGSSVMFWRLSREHQDAVENWRHAQQAERGAEEELVQSRLAQARAGRFTRQAGRHFGGLRTLTEAAQLARNLNFSEDRLQELRNEAIACMALTDLQPARRLEDLAAADLPTGFAPQVAFDSRWEVYARGDAEGNVSVRRLADDQELAHLSGVGNTAAVLLFSPDGCYLAAKYYLQHSGRPVECLVWDWRQGKPVVRQKCDAHTRPIADLAFSLDSRQLILGGRRDGTLRFYDLASGQEVRQLNLGSEPPCSIVLDPDGKRLAASHGGQVTIRSLDTGLPLASWRPPALVSLLAWHPDGQLLAGACGRTVYLWDAASGQQLRTLEGHENQVVHITFNHAGTLLTSCAGDGATRLWDPYDGSELVTARGCCLAFSPDDRHLAYRSRDEVGLWEVAHERVCRTLYGHRADVFAVQPSPDGRLIASAGQDGIRLWDANAGRQIAQLPVGRTANVLFHPEGESILTSGNRGVYRWPLRRAAGGAGNRLRLGPAREVRVPIAGRTGPAAIDRRWRHLAVVDAGEKGIVLDPEDPSRPALLPHDRAFAIAISPDGRWAATATFTGADVKVWDLSQGDSPQPAHTIRSGAAAVTFSPDGRWLVVQDGGWNRFYEVGSWQVDAEMSGRNRGGVPVFAADSSVAAVSTEGGRQVELIATATGRRLATLVPYDARMLITPRGFSGDGSRLAMATSGFAIQLWDLRAVRRQLAEMDLDWDLPPYPPASTGPREPLEPLEVEGPLPPSSDRTPAAGPDESLRARLAPGDADAYEAPGPPAIPPEAMRDRLALYSLAIALTPYHPELYHQRGHVYEKLWQPEKAVADFTAALSCESLDRPRQTAHLYVARAANMRQMKEHGRARDDLRRAVDLDPSNLDACNSLAWLYAAGPENLRDPKQAFILSKRTVVANPDEGHYLKTLGVTYYRMAEPERAIVALERSQRALKEESAADSWFFLAMCHWRLRDRTRARDCLGLAVRWMEDHQGKLSPARSEELEAFRAEAEGQIAKSK